MNYNLVFFRDEIEIFIISLFETRSRFVPSISRASRRDRDLYLLYLVLRDEIENLLYQILNFEKGTRNKKGFLVIEREFSSLILTRFFKIENSRQCLMGIWAYVKKYGQVGYPRKDHQKCNIFLAFQTDIDKNSLSRKVS